MKFSLKFKKITSAALLIIFTAVVTLKPNSSAASYPLSGPIDVVFQGNVISSSQWQGGGNRIFINKPADFDTLSFEGHPLTGKSFTWAMSNGINGGYNFTGKISWSEYTFSSLNCSLLSEVKIEMKLSEDLLYLEYCGTDLSILGHTLINRSGNQYNLTFMDAPEIDGKLFRGWSTSPTAYRPVSDSVENSNSLGAAGSKKLTVYAWYDNVVDVEFDTNNADSGTPPKTIKYTSSGTYSFPEQGELARDGYTFMGWGDAPDSFENGGTIYIPGSQLTLEDPDSNKTFYAQWCENYTLSYDANAGGETILVPASVEGSPDSSGKVEVKVSETTDIKWPGHKFKGWNTAADGSGSSAAPGSTLELTEDTTLYAVWDSNSYNITFNDNGAVTPSGIGPFNNLTYGSVVSIPQTDLKKDYYVFKGWSANSDGTGDFYADGGNITIDEDTPEDMTLYAKWEDAETYTLSYSKNAENVTGDLPDGGTYYGDGLNDTAIVGNSELGRTGYTFSGWSTTSEGPVEYTAGSSITLTKDTTLFAVWTEGTYTLSYNFNAGSETSAYAPLSVQGQISSNITAAEQGQMYWQDYRFTGWNTESGGGGVTYSPGMPILLDHNMTLYAQWEDAPHCTLTYDRNCSDQMVVVPDDTTDYRDDGIQDKGTVDELLPVRFGYEFQGWNTQSDGSGTSYQPGAEITVASDTTLFAVWEMGTYTLSYDLNDPQAEGSTPAPVTGSLNTPPAAAEITEFSLKHHRFLSWNTKPSGDGISYQPGKPVTVGQDMTLYAIWEKNTYEIKFSLNAADASGTLPGALSGTYTDQFTAPDGPDIIRAKYLFDGWNDNPYGDGTTYVPGTRYSFEDNKTLYVNWLSVPPYEMTYDANAPDASGKLPTDDKLYCQDGVSDNQVSVLAPGELKRPGYVFIGWNTHKEGDGTAYQPEDVFTITKHITLYAQWTPGSYKLTYNKNASNAKGNLPAGGTYLSTKSITAASGSSLKRADYEFTAWNTRSDGKGTSYKPGNTFRILKDTVLYAQWKSLVNVSFGSSGGKIQGQTDFQVSEGTKLGDLTLPSVESGYSISGIIVNGVKVSDYENYVIKDDSNVTIILEKKKAPKPNDNSSSGGNTSGGSENDTGKTPGGDSSTDGRKPDNNSGGSSGNNPDSGSSGNGSDGSSSGGSSSDGSSSGGGQSLGGSTAGGADNGTQVPKGSGSPRAKAYKPGVLTDGNGTSGSGIYQSKGTSGTSDASSGSSAGAASGRGQSSTMLPAFLNGAYGPITDCIIHWIILLGILLLTIYTILRGRYIKKEQLLKPAFFFDRLLPVLAVPLGILAWIFRFCLLDAYMIAVFILLGIGSVLYLRRQCRLNEECLEEELESALR